MEEEEEDREEDRNGVISVGFSPNIQMNRLALVKKL